MDSPCRIGTARIIKLKSINRSNQIETNDDGDKNNFSPPLNNKTFTRRVIEKKHVADFAINRDINQTDEHLVAIWTNANDNDLPSSTNGNNNKPTTINMAKNNNRCPSIFESNRKIINSACNHSLFETKEITLNTIDISDTDDSSTFCSTCSSSFSDDFDSDSNSNDKNEFKNYFYGWFFLKKEKNFNKI